MIRHSFIILITLGGIISPQLVYSQNFDKKWTVQINQNRTPDLDNWIYPLSQSVYPMTVGLPLTELAIGYFKKDPSLFKKGVSTLGSVTINYLTTKLLKETIDRERPFTQHPFEINPYYLPTDPSFPSGHTSGAFTLATIASIHYPKWYIILPAYAWAGGIAYSRMYLGVHYFSDVAAGALLGTGSAIGTHYLNDWFHRQYNYTQKLRIESLPYQE